MAERKMVAPPVLTAVLEEKLAGESEAVRAEVARRLAAWLEEEVVDPARLTVAGDEMVAARLARSPQEWVAELEPYGLVPVAARWPKCPLPEVSGAAGGSSLGPRPPHSPPAFKGVPDQWDRRYWDLRDDGVHLCRTLGGLEQSRKVCSPVWPVRVDKRGSTYAVKGMTGWREVLVEAPSDFTTVLEVLTAAGLTLAKTVRWEDPRYSADDSGGALRHPEDDPAGWFLSFLTTHQGEAVLR